MVEFNTKTDYSKIAERYDKVRPSPADIWILKIIEFGNIEDKFNVLDVGCGTGRFPLAIYEVKECDICALDPSIEMLKKAVEKDISNLISWIRGDGQYLPFRENVFNCVYMTLVIHHIEDKKKAIKEIYRTLKVAGKCVIMTNSHARLRKQVIRHFPGVIAYDLKRFPTIPYLKNVMKDLKYKIIKYKPVQYNEYISKEEYMERVKNKYISTLTLFSDEEFKKRYKIFENKILRKYGSEIIRHTGFDFIIGEK